MGLAVGITSIRFALEGLWELAISSILLSCIFDALDGRIARILNASSIFGAELDSLCDFVNFGIAPGMILYLWALSTFEYKITAWSSILFFAMCIAIRLARFNATSHDTSNAELKRRFFTGVPAPAAGMLALMPIIATFDTCINYNIQNQPIIIVVYIVCIGILAASRIPTFSFKNIHIKRDRIWIVMLCVAAIITSMVMYTWSMLLITSFIYIGMIPISYFCSLKYFLKNDCSTPDESNKDQILKE